MSKFNKILLFISFVIVMVIVIVAVTNAWTNPSGNPPSGGGALYYSGGNVGIGTTTPTTAKLVVDGTISASAPTADSHVATKAYVDAAASDPGNWECVIRSAGPAIESIVYCIAPEKVISGGATWAIPGNLYHNTPIDPQGWYCGVTAGTCTAYANCCK